MGQCLCGRARDHQGLITLFFDKLKIISTPTINVKEILLKHVTKDNLLSTNELVFKSEIFPLLETTSNEKTFKDVTTRFWEVAYLSFLQFHSYLSLTLIMLSDGEALEKTHAFYELLKKFGCKDIRSAGDSNTPLYLIKKETFSEFLSFYIFFMTIFALDKVAKLSEDEDEFRFALEHVYGVEYRNLLVNYYLEHYLTELNLLEFFDLNFHELSHQRIREKLFSVYTDYYQQSYRNIIKPTLR